MTESTPVLYAALLCERVFNDEDGVSTLFRVVDTFNFTLTASPPKGEAPEQRMTIGIGGVLFTRWGGPAGQYTERVTLVDSEGKEHDMASSITFELKGGHQFQQIRHVLRMQFKQPGAYALRVYLNERSFIDVPFQVNIRHETR